MGTVPDDAANRCPGLDSFVLFNYYDLPLTEYIAYTRTGDATFLAYAQKCADSWWQHPQWIQQGAQTEISSNGMAHRQGTPASVG